MKIIFDNEQEKLDFVQWTCPRLRDPKVCERKVTCAECWETEYPGVLEVRNENNI